MNQSMTLTIKTLTGEWCDKDIVMLHACFQLLTDCIESEDLFTGYYKSRVMASGLKKSRRAGFRLYNF